LQIPIHKSQITKMTSFACQFRSFGH